MKRMAVHNGIFHADDVFGVALMQSIYNDLEIIRTRDEELLKTCDIVSDVGNGKYDHHHVDKIRRENGIPYCGFGLLWRDFGISYINAKFPDLSNLKEQQEVAEKVDTILIQQIDAQDNGVDVMTSQVPIMTLCDIIYTFIPTGAGEDEIEKGFFEAVEFAKKILYKITKKFVDSYENYRMIKNELKKQNVKQSHILVLEKSVPWKDTVLELDRNDVCVDDLRIYNFDSSKVFGISAPACLLYIKMSTSNSKCRECEVYDIETPNTISGRISFQNGKLSNLDDDVLDLDGESVFEWRQGVKHDCAGVMELEKQGENNYKNKNKEKVELEDLLVFPLMKSSSFKKPIINSDFTKYVIVTQKKAREETNYIEALAPKTWKYLCDRKDVFDSRRSSIYKGAPAFSMFGVGDYSYAKYKVGISGFYKRPLFALLYNENKIEHPIMVDDTSYFLSFDNYSDAYTCMLLLNSSRVQKFLLSISFQDAKRPYTKKVLQRLDFNKCVHNIAFGELVATEKELKLHKSITEEMYASFANYITGLKKAI